MTIADLRKLTPELIAQCNEIAATLIRYVGVGYRSGAVAGVITPTPESWDWPSADTWTQHMTIDQQKAARHRVSVRTVIHERFAMHEQRRAKQ